MGLTNLVDFAASLAVLALLAESYGFVRRRLVGNRMAPTVLGCVFGLMAVVQMHQPFQPIEGLIIDMRAVPIALAGAFLGLRGLLPCLAIAALMRISIGGVGMEVGLLAMVIAGTAGFLWARHFSNQEQRNLKALIGLALAMSTSMVAALLLPTEASRLFFSQAAPYLVVLYMVAIPVIGALLERENRRLRREVGHDARAMDTNSFGLLPARRMVRETRNAFAAHPFGTFGGVLVVGVTRAGWLGLASVGGMSVEQRGRIVQALRSQLIHGDLAGQGVEGRIVVPLTMQEVAQGAALLENLELTFDRKLKSRCAVAGHDIQWGFGLVATPNPADFLKRMERAVYTAADVIGIPAERPFQGPKLAPRIRRQTHLLGADEEDVLFAKAGYLMEHRSP